MIVHLIDVGYFITNVGLGIENMEIFDRLKAVRLHLRMTQLEIASACGAKLPSWKSNEGGKSIPGGKVLAGLSRLGVNVDWVLTGEGEMMDNQDPLSFQQKQVLGALDEFCQRMGQGMVGAKAIIEFVNEYNSNSSIVDSVDGIEKLDFDELSGWVHQSKHKRMSIPGSPYTREQVKADQYDDILHDDSAAQRRLAEQQRAHFSRLRESRELLSKICDSNKFTPGGATHGMLHSLILFYGIHVDDLDMLIKALKHDQSAGNE